MNNRIADLKRIEQLALEALDGMRGGRHYEGKEQDAERLQQVARKAIIERLELELKFTHD